MYLNLKTVSSPAVEKIVGRAAPPLSTDPVNNSPAARAAFIVAYKNCFNKAPPAVTLKRRFG